MNCLCCGKKLRGIKEDVDYQNWQRKYHKNCWKDRNIWYNMYWKVKLRPNSNPKFLEFYEKKSCLK